MLDILNYNIEKNNNNNQHNIITKPYFWGSDMTDLFDSKPFDVVVGSDLIFAHEVMLNAKLHIDRIKNFDFFLQYVVLIYHFKDFHIHLDCILIPILL